ncbi:MAG: preprotein translocase subunit SecG [Chloroflexi bacterium]|nr:preprotein translocase subunit SecG [Chloroflexota bacterium]
MATYIQIAQLVLSLVLTLAILLQVRGGGLGGIFGGQETVFRTKRGLEKTLFQVTVVMAILFVLISIFGVRVVSGG